MGKGTPCGVISFACHDPATPLVQPLKANAKCKLTIVQRLLVMFNGADRFHVRSMHLVSKSRNGCQTIGQPMGFLKAREAPIPAWPL
jgi:hypothetical protein